MENARRELSPPKMIGSSSRRMRTQSLLALALTLLGTASLTVVFSASRRFPPPPPPFDHRNATAHESYNEVINLQSSGDAVDEVAPKKSNSLMDFEDVHGHDRSPGCTKDATPTLFEEWRKSKKTICSHGKMSVEKYTLKSWEYEPAFTVYRNVPMRSLYSMGGSFNYDELKRAVDEYKGGTNGTTAINHPVIRIKAHEPLNSYERFHAYLNVVMAIAMFDIKDPQIVDIIPEKKLKEFGQIPQHDMEMYQSFSSVKPLIVPEGGNKDSLNVTFIPFMIDMFNSGTSILVSRTSGAFRGRGTDHHCKSTLFQGMLKWMKSNLLGSASAKADLENDANQTIQVVWSSRGPYCCRPEGRVYKPHRAIVNEDELVRRIGQALGEKYNITIVNFGSTTTLDSVKIAAQSRIIAGVHGAGLVWSSFLPPHSGVIELFGGDRGIGNRHYHNIASLADVHYRSLNLRGTIPWTSMSRLAWDDDTVSKIVWKIRSIDFDKEPGDREPALPPRQCLALRNESSIPAWCFNDPPRPPPPPPPGKM